MYSYEELRSTIVDVLLGGHRVTYPPNQWGHLKLAVAEVLARQQGQSDPSSARLNGKDSELLRDVFWDLFRQGYITLGLDNDNAEWPFFRLSHFGQKALEQNTPYRFTDSSSYIAMVRSKVGRLDELTVVYLDEAVQAFYAGCLLASCVMLGVAAEHCFGLLLDAIAKSPTHGPTFASVAKERTFFAKLTKFKNLLQPTLLATMPSSLREDLDTNLAGALSLIRTHRNEAGHPTGKQMDREQVYVLLQLFAPYAQKLAGLRDFFSAAAKVPCPE
ncbi:MAG TPA: hypothetical protein VFG14_05305 [Chthoniobacteraceae bacterium]|nr:hypothetical protein [Chthoniobacteraceae bacterium]